MFRMPLWNQICVGRLPFRVSDRKRPHNLICAFQAISRTALGAAATFVCFSRLTLIKIGARVIEHIARIRVQLPTSCPEAALFRTIVLRLMPSGP